MDFKKHLDFVKDNLNLIIILPPLLGGLWQIIELSSISFSFIRFFSVSQMIPDGLLVLLILSIMSLSLYWMRLIYKTIEEKAESETAKIKNPNVITAEKKKYWKVTMLILIFFGLVVLLGYVSKFFIDNIEETYSLFWFLPVNIVISLFVLLSWKYATEHSFIYKKNGVDTLDYLILMYVLIEFMLIMSFLSAFHTAFMLPKELSNVENLNCKIENIQSKHKMEILYANDKYIFVGYRVPSKEKGNKLVLAEIRIFKFDDLLDDSTCIENKKRNLFVKDSITESKKEKIIKDSIAGSKKAKG